MCKGICGTRYKQSWRAVKENWCSGRKNIRAAQKKSLGKKNREIARAVLQAEPGLPEMQKIIQPQQEVQQILEQEDMKWRQRSKENWLKNGDRNTMCKPEEEKKLYSKNIRWIGTVVEYNWGRGSCFHWLFSYLVHVWVSNVDKEYGTRKTVHKGGSASCSLPDVPLKSSRTWWPFCWFLFRKIGKQLAMRFAKLYFKLLPLVLLS